MRKHFKASFASYEAFNDIIVIVFLFYLSFLEIITYHLYTGSIIVQ